MTGKGNKKLQHNDARHLPLLAMHQATLELEKKQVRQLRLIRATRLQAARMHRRTTVLDSKGIGSLAVVFHPQGIYPHNQNLKVHCLAAVFPLPEIHLHHQKYKQIRRLGLRRVFSLLRHQEPKAQTLAALSLQVRNVGHSLKDKPRLCKPQHLG